MTLRTRLDDAARFDAEYGHNLASHLTMALVALARLGAGEQRLEQFAARYAERLHAAPPPEPWPSGEPWKSGFGDPRTWPAYRTLFNDWLDHEGAGIVLAQALPPLMRGGGAAAFHGLIRCACAVAAGHSHELADALAYWACRWFTLGEPQAETADSGECDPAEVLARLRIAKPRAPLIAERMALVAQHTAFAHSAAALRIDDPEQTLQLLATLAARLYAASGNFTVLHLVTSAHALRVLLPWIDADDRRCAVRHYWQAFAAGHAASGLEPAATGGPPRDWKKIVTAAIASDDEHLIKLVDSCRQQEHAYGGSVWREAASRALRAVRPPIHPPDSARSAEGA